MIVVGLLLVILFQILDKAVFNLSQKIRNVKCCQTDHASKEGDTKNKSITDNINYARDTNGNASSFKCLNQFSSSSFCSCPRILLAVIFTATSWQPYFISAVDCTGRRTIYVDHRFELRKITNIEGLTRPSIF
jgi:hypothetical protein